MNSETFGTEPIALLNPLNRGLENGRAVDSARRSAIGSRIRGLENFGKVFAIRPGESVLILADPLLDPRVIEAVYALASSRGASCRAILERSTRVEKVPEEWMDAIGKADFVVSTWFNSVLDPYFVSLRRKGQRWVKITYFRNIELLESPQACFPLDVLGEILKATARKLPARGAFELRFFDEVGSDFRIQYTQEMRENLLTQNRWRGDVTAGQPGSYAQYVPLHGPNLWDRTTVKMNNEAAVQMSGVVYAQWAVGFDKPFNERIGIRFVSDQVVEVIGSAPEAAILRADLVGGRLIELGCGFNPAARRHDIYPAGSNAPGALHFGIDLPNPSRYIRLTMPDWEEPAVHHDLCMFDMSVVAGDQLIIDKGFLTALRDEEVVRSAAAYGDPLPLLEGAH